MLQLLIPALSTLIGRVIDRAVPDKAEAERLKAEITLAVLNQSHAELQGAVNIILAEAQGQSWLQRNWRPILMLTIVAIVANNYLLAPYVNAIFGSGTAPILDLPEKLWTLMNIGVGGYVIGRSAEKAVQAWKGTPGN